MKRREFLTSVAAATAALPHLTGRAEGAFEFAAEPAPPKPGGEGGLKLGVASYSLRKFPFEKALEMAKSLEVKYINYKDVHIPRTASPDEIRVARAKTEAAGLTILGGGTISMKNDEAAVRKDFEYARLAGMPVIVAAPTHDALDVVERLAKEFDIRVAIHNHGPEDKHFPSPYDVYKAVKSRDSHMGLCVDVGHTVRTGVDVTKAVLDLKDRVYDFHVKDLRDLKDKDSQVIVGKGAIDYPALFRALLRIKFTGHVGLEYEIDVDNPLPGMQQSFAYMRGVLDAIAT
jgi:sugar phosphate isomerase/epimerase